MKIKTCKKCGFVGDESLFIEDENLCKECGKIRNKERRKRKIKDQEGNEKICKKCKIIGEENLFEKGMDICKKCRKEQREQLAKAQEGKNKTCKKCEFIGNSILFGPGDICKKCMKKNRKQRIKNKEGTEQTCIKCKFIGNSILFGPGNICKKCIKKNNKQRIKNKEGTEQTCTKCKFIGNSDLFGRHNVCKKCLGEDNNKYRRNRTKKDPAYRLRNYCSKSVYTMLKSQNSSKAGKSCKGYFPFNIEELKSSIESKFESWMNWDNQGNYKIKTWDDNDVSTQKWNLDHLIPQSLLPYSDMIDKTFKIVWDLANLRPLSAKQNLLESNRRIITGIKNEQEFNDIVRLIFLLEEIINDEDIKQELIDFYNNFKRITEEYKLNRN